jgi:hypothetical protein
LVFLFIVVICLIIFPMRSVKSEGNNFLELLIKFDVFEVSNCFCNVFRIVHCEFE